MAARMPLSRIESACGRAPAFNAYLLSSCLPASISKFVYLAIDSYSYLRSDQIVVASRAHDIVRLSG